MQKTDLNCFAGPAFFDAIEEQRLKRDLSWTSLGRVTGVSPGTIKRFATGDKIEADGVLALLRWLGRPLEDFSPSNSHLNSGVAPLRATPGTMLRRDTLRLYGELRKKAEQNGVGLLQIAESTGVTLAQIKGLAKGGRTDIRTFLKLLNYLDADFHGFTRTTNS